MAPRHALALLATAVLLAVPAASAHTAYTTADGKYRLAVGNLNEPVYTFVKTGLDVIITSNDTARTPFPISNPGDLTATLIAPDGHTLSQPLTKQFGTVNRLTFQEGYVLTQPGQYKVHLVGTINGTAIDATINDAGVLGDQKDITFPDTQVPSSLELASRVAALEQQVSAMSASSSAPATHKSPAPVAAYLVIALAVLAAARRVKA